MFENLTYFAIISKIVEIMAVYNGQENINSCNKKKKYTVTGSHIIYTSSGQNEVISKYLV